MQRLLSVRDVGYHPFRADGAHAYLARGANADGPVWVLAFRGTESDYNDILVDITLFKRTADYGREYRCHGGFLTSLQTFWGSWGSADAIEFAHIDASLFGPEGISEVLYREVNRGERHYVTGHSLGGALASLAAYYIARDLPSCLTALYTFGCPRVYAAPMSRGVERAAAWPSYRVIHAADIITRVPFRVLGLRHFGTPVYLGRDGAVKESPTQWERLKDVGVMRVVYFVVVFLLAAALIALGGEWLPERSVAASLLAGWPGWVAALAVAVLALGWFARAVPYLPNSLVRRLGLKEFSDHRIGAYANKLARSGGA